MHSFDEQSYLLLSALLNPREGWTAAGAMLPAHSGLRRCTLACSAQLHAANRAFQTRPSHADDAPLLQAGQAGSSAAPHDVHEGSGPSSKLSARLWLLTFCSGIAGFLFG